MEMSYMRFPRGNTIGEGGARYYVAGTSMNEIVGRMLMLGDVGEVDARRDISAGDVYGVCYTNGVNQIKVWIKNDALVAYPWSSAPPVHL